MRLTAILSYYVRRRHIPGKLDIGKHRFIPRIIPKMKKDAMRNVVEEQRNLDVINRPYITEEEESAYKNYLIQLKTPEKEHLAAIEARREQNWKKLENRHLEAHLEHLKADQKWE